MFPTEKNEVPLIMRDGIPINCFLSPTLQCHKGPIQHSHHRRHFQLHWSGSIGSIHVLEEMVLQLDWATRASPWSSQAHMDTWFIQAGSVLDEGGMATAALWHCRGTDTELGNALDQSGWFMLNHVWRNKCMYQIKPYSPLFFPPLFILKCWRGFQQ